MVSVLDSGANGPGSSPGARFSKVPKTFSGPKSHLRNCQLLVLESRSFSMLSRYQKEN